MLADFFASPLFRFMLFPMGSAALGVGIKYVTRNDSYARFQKEDLAVGLELLLTACLMFLALTSDWSIELSSLQREMASAPAMDATKLKEMQIRALDVSQELAAAGWVLLLLFVALWSISTLVRKVGWKSQNEMQPLWGIAIPLAIGILALIVVMAYAS